MCIYSRSFRLGHPRSTQSLRMSGFTGSVGTLNTPTAMVHASSADPTVAGSSRSGGAGLVIGPGAGIAAATAAPGQNEMPPAFLIEAETEVAPVATADELGSPEDEEEVEMEQYQELHQYQNGM